MNKPATYYFLLQSGVHVFFDWGIGHLNNLMISVYHKCMDPRWGLPDLTELAMAIPWWPYAIAGIAAAGAILSLLLTDRLRILQHFAFALQCVSTVLLFVLLMSYMIPFTHINVAESFRALGGP